MSNWAEISGRCGLLGSTRNPSFRTFPVDNCSTYDWHGPVYSLHPRAVNNESRYKATGAAFVGIDSFW